MAYVTRNGIRRKRPESSNGIQYLVKLEGTKAVFECKKGHRMTKDFSKGRKKVREDMLQKMAPYWGLGLQSNGTRGHCYGWCQKCQNEADANR
jgi:hypothetical protein